MAPTRRHSPGNLNLILTAPNNRAGPLLDTLSQYVKVRKEYGICVTLTQPAASLIRMMKKRGIDPSMVMILDATSSLPEPDEPENVIHVGRNASLTDISICITSMLKNFPESKRFLVFDSIDAIARVGDTALVRDFVKFLVSKLSEWKTEGTLLCSGQMRRELADSLSMLVGGAG